MTPTDAEREAMEATLARELADEIVQMLADSEPNDASIGGMVLLEGTEFESLFVVDGETIARIADVVLSNALYDKRLALATEAVGQRWQPIATAPKNGEPILVCCRNYANSGWFHEIATFAVKTWRGGNAGLINPTYWMPLPPSPGDQS